ncbi:MAG TPA: tetratricopeptide repeat protein [Steroidobacteraceae bacterium]|nr:tetratricopeptide repeat protein [Steroidobacteraceae bacterium]
MDEPLPRAGQVTRAAPERLDSWKAIAAYLKRDVTTAQRWERRESMPVHRHVHDKRGSVYALASELDAWRAGRSAESSERASQAPAGPFPDGTPAGVAAAGGAAGMDAVARTRVDVPWLRGVLLLLGLTLLLGALWVAQNPLHLRPGGHPTARKISSLAVLPLRNLSGDPAQEYLADGMTEALIGRLANLHDLRVVSHTSVMRFKNPQISLPEIGRILGADAIVEGSVTRAGDRVRVTAQLVRAASDEHFWSATYDRELKDALNLESDLAQTIAERVEVTVTGEERERLAASRTVAPQVYENYLHGQFALRESRDKDGLDASVGYFAGALQLDPTFAPAYLGLAKAYTSLGLVAVGDPPNETRPRVISAARKALELDPDLAEAHVLLANTEQEQWHWAQAQAEYRRALDLTPNDAGAHAEYALWLLCQGRTDEAVRWVRRGRELDPLAVSGGDVAWILFQSRRYEEAVAELRSDLAVRPNDVAALTTLGFVLSATDHAREAVPILEKVLSLSKGSPAATGVLIRAYARAGQRGDAVRLLTALKRRRAAGYVPAAAFVNAYLGLDDHEAAFQWLEHAYAEQSNILQFLKVHPYFDPIRADPRFANLVRHVWSDSQ